MNVERSGPLVPAKGNLPGNPFLMRTSDNYPRKSFRLRTFRTLVESIFVNPVQCVHSTLSEKRGGGGYPLRHSRKALLPVATTRLISPTRHIRPRRSRLR